PLRNPANRARRAGGDVGRERADRRARAPLLGRQVAGRAHQEVLDPQRMDPVLVRDLFAAVELELPLAPDQHVEDQVVSQVLDRLEKLLARHRAALDQELEEALTRSALFVDESGEAW